MCPHVSHVSNDLKHKYFFRIRQSFFKACVTCVHVSNDLKHKYFFRTRQSCFKACVTCVHVSNDLKHKYFFRIRQTVFKAFVNMYPCVQWFETKLLFLYGQSFFKACVHILLLYFKGFLIILSLLVSYCARIVSCNFIVAQHGGLPPFLKISKMQGFQNVVFCKAF